MRKGAYCITMESCLEASSLQAEAVHAEQNDDQYDQHRRDLHYGDEIHAVGNCRE